MRLSSHVWLWRRVNGCSTHALRCSDSPAPPRPASGSVSCGKTPELRSGPSLSSYAVGVSFLKTPWHQVFSVFSLLLAALWKLKPACRAPRSAHPKSKHRVPPRVQKSDYFGVITFKAPHREKSPVARIVSRVRASSEKKMGALPLKSSLVVVKLREMEG